MSLWFRLYTEVLNDPKVQSLSGDLFKTWVNVLCIAAENDGVLPDFKALQFLLRCNAEAVTKALQELTEAGLLAVTKNQYGETYQPHNWTKRQYKSDSSADRVKRHRERHKTVTQAVTVTPPETETDTETEQNRTEKPPLSPLPEKPIPLEAQVMFEAAWQAWPARKKKDQARLAYAEATRRGITHETIMRGIGKFCSHHAEAKTPPHFLQSLDDWLTSDGWTQQFKLTKHDGRPVL